VALLPLDPLVELVERKRHGVHHVAIRLAAEGPQLTGP
jgi:hypothetical protein